MNRRAYILVAIALAAGLPAAAQDTPKANPLEGLFTPQPQYPTAQTQSNPEPKVEGANPIGGVFNHGTNQYVTPSTPGGANPLSGLFTGQNPHATSQTAPNPDPSPRNPGPYGTETPQQQQAVEKPAEGAPAAAPAAQAAAAPAGGPAPAAAAAAPGKEAPGGGGGGGAAEGEKAAEGEDGEKTAEGEEDEDGAKKAKPGEKTAAKKPEPKKEEPKPVAAGPYNPVREAITLMNGGDYDAAVQTLNAALKTNPNNPEAHYVCGVAYVGLRNYQAAAAAYGKVIQLSPLTPLAQLATEGLRKIGAPAPATPKMPPLH